MIIWSRGCKKCHAYTDSNFNPLRKISVGFRLTAGRNSKGHYVCSGVCYVVYFRSDSLINQFHLTEHCLAQASSSMQVLVMSLVLCFYFVNFSNKKIICVCD